MFNAFPLTSRRPCYPGGAPRCVLSSSSQTYLPSPLCRGSASPIPLPGYFWVCFSLRPVTSQPASRPETPSSASAGHLAMSRREPRYPVARLLSG